MTEPVVPEACRALRERAGFLAALRDGDPEQAAAIAHAAGCPGCASALEEGRATIAMLERAGAAEPLEQARIDAVRAALAPRIHPPPSRLASLTLVPATLAGGALALFFAADRVPFGPLWRDVGFVALISLLAAAFAARRAPLSLGISLAAGVALAQAQGGEGALWGDHGARCLFAELFAASVPAAAAAWLLRDRPTIPPLAAAAAAGALAGGAGLLVSCADRGVGHLFLFHAGGIALAALAGGLIARPLSLRPID